MTIISVEEATVQVVVDLDTGGTVIVDYVPPVVSGGGGGSMPVAEVSGTPNDLILTVDGLVVGDDPIVLTLIALANNTGPGTAVLNGSAPVPILSRTGAALVPDELIAEVPAMAIFGPTSLQLIVS